MKGDSASKVSRAHATQASVWAGSVHCEIRNEVVARLPVRVRRRRRGHARDRTVKVLDHECAELAGRPLEGPDHHLDGRVRQLREERRLPVVEGARRGTASRRTVFTTGYGIALDQVARPVSRTRAAARTSASARVGVVAGVADRDCRTASSPSRRGHGGRRPAWRARPGGRRRTRGRTRTAAARPRADAAPDRRGPLTSGCVRYSNEVTTPKLPPPPRSAQKRSGSVSSLAVTTSPDASTTSAESRLSTAIPYLPISQPMPAAERETRRSRWSRRCRSVVARPKAPVARSNSPTVTPACARAVRRAGSTWIPFISERSIISPPSVTALPATLWPPPRTEISSPSLAAEVDGVGDVRGVQAARDQRRDACRSARCGRARASS